MVVSSWIIIVPCMYVTRPEGLIRKVQEEEEEEEGGGGGEVYT
jgi:hypothetical protein